MVAPVANLFDDFNIAPIDTSKWTVTSGAWSEATGSLCGTVPSTPTIESTSAWSLLQSAAFLEIGSYLNGAGASAGKSHFEMYSTANPANDVYMEVNASTGQIKYARQAAGVDVETLTQTYDPVAMKWWRIRNSAGLFLFETSPDSANWVTRFTATSQSWVSSVKVLLFVSQTGGTTTTKCFDNFNIGSASSRAVSVGSEFEVTADGKLRIERCDQPDSSWSYPCSQSAYNALRVSEDPCGLWVQPPPKQYLDTIPVSVATTDEERTILTFELTNPDTCRYMLFYLPVTAGLRFTLAANDDNSAIPVTSWALGIQVTGVDNPDDGYTTIIAGDFHQPGTHLWRGVTEYYWTAPPGETTTIEVKLKTFKGGGAAGAITGYQARLGILGWSEVDQ